MWNSCKIELMFRTLLSRPWIFELGASFYAWFTAQHTWRESCARLVAHFPEARDGAGASFGSVGEAGDSAAHPTPSAPGGAASDFGSAPKGRRKRTLGTSEGHRSADEARGQV